MTHHSPVRPPDQSATTALAGWACALARVVSFGVEGTGSYGSGLAAYLVVEVNRGDRRARRGNGKSDDLDAEAAARAVQIDLTDADMLAVLDTTPRPADAPSPALV